MSFLFKFLTRALAATAASRLGLKTDTLGFSCTEGVLVGVPLVSVTQLSSKVLVFIRTLQGSVCGLKLNSSNDPIFSRIESTYNGKRPSPTVLCAGSDNGHIADSRLKLASFMRQVVMFPFCRI